MKEMRIPTEQEVADFCGVSRKTVCLHMAKLDITELRPPIKAYADRIMLALVKKAMEGDVPAIKLALQLGFDWSEKQRLEETVKLEADVPIRVVNVYRQTRDDEAVLSDQSDN